MTPTEKYFRKNPVAHPLASGYRCAAIIPACDEVEYFPGTLGSLRRAIAAAAEPVAVIVVVNHPPDGNENASLELLNILEREEDLFTLYLPGITGGVGEARKAGMDAFLAGQKPEDLAECVIFSLDADTIVEAEYFSAVMPLVRRHKAAALNFSHLPAGDAATQSAIDRYEAYLRRYREKLRAAGSPYAFFTIGSAFAVRGDVYIRAGGMKVRRAGEDFYFLQAVAKTSGVHSVEEIYLHPSPRQSARVPFGTGPAIRDLLAGKPLNEIPDEPFEKLKTVLRHAASSTLDDGEKFLAQLPDKSAEFFHNAGFLSAWGKIVKNTPPIPEARRKAFHEWFDGLKTLKFLHFYRDFC